MRESRITQKFRLDGRRALITGAAGHLGRAFSGTLAELGAELLLVDRPGAPLDEVREDLLPTTTAPVHVVECDLEVEREREDLIKRVNTESAGLSVLVNNAAFLGGERLKGWAEPFEQQGLEAWRRALEVNLTAAFHLVQGLSNRLTTSPGASVVNLGSIHGNWGPDWRLYEGTGMANPAAYAASKAGIHQMTRWLATTLAPDIRVNAIAPGGIHRGQPGSFVDAYTSRTPLGRMATEDDMCGALALLATDASAYVTGQVLVVDGGWGVW